MKKILSLVLVLILVMSSLLLVACDDKADEAAATTVATTAATTADDDNGGSKPADPVKVENVNGMTAIELYEKFMDEYTTAETYDVKLTMDMTEDGVTEREEVIVKLGADAAYLKMDMDGGIREYWGIDGYVYYSGSFEGDTQKVKIEGELTSVLGDMISTMLSFPVEKDDMSEAYLAEVEKAELYLYAGQYYYTVSLVETEDDKEVTTTETVYFDAQGKATKIVIESEGEKLVAVLNSYGKPVTVKAPADLDSFVDMDEVGGGEGGSGEGAANDYLLYSTVFNFIDNADTYDLYVMVDYEPQLEYAVDAEGDEALCAYAEGMISEMWHVGDQVYVRQNGGEISSAAANEDTLSAFASVRMQKQVMSTLRLEEEQITSISIEEIDGGHCIMVVEDAGDGMVYHYSIEFAEDFSKIAIDMVCLQDGEPDMVISYRLREIGNSSFDIVAPF